MTLDDLDLQGHPRSSVYVIWNQYATSYYWSVAT